MSALSLADQAKHAAVLDHSKIAVTERTRRRSNWTLGRHLVPEREVLTPVWLSELRDLKMAHEYHRPTRLSDGIPAQHKQLKSRQPQSTS
jgi:hypothetical protein